MKRSGKAAKSSNRSHFLSGLRRGRHSISVGTRELHRDFHSTPDLAHSPPQDITSRAHHSQEDVAYKSPREPLRPPPSHPPPPPPIGQLVKVDTSRASKSEYEVVRDNNPITEPEQDGIMSSFRPADNAKLYASPNDIKSVGFRSRSLPTHAARPNVRKSHSLRTQVTYVSNNPRSTRSNTYAQPINLREARSTTTAPEKPPKQPPPPIPEPDYSLSESSDEENNSSTNHVVRLHVTQSTQLAETSGSSSGSGTSSMHHSFTVDEIQKVRTQLKSSKSYPNDFLKKVVIVDDEDCDNSSSGVSSDQEVSRVQVEEQRKVNRNTVSLVQLPPPAEHPVVEPVVVLPPPPEFEASSHAPAEPVVLAPPPQFSDHSRHQMSNKARIVGAVAKNSSANKQGRLHSQ